MKTRDDVQLIIDTASTWVLQQEAPEGPYGVWCGGEYQLIQASALGLVDTRLPLVFRIMISRSNRFPANLNGASIKNTQRFWAGELLSLAGPNESLYIAHVLTAIRTPFGIDSDFIFFEGEFSSATEITNPSSQQEGPIYYIEAMYEKTVPVLASWLDQEYPGWRKRLELMQAIATSDADILSEVLVKPVSVPPIDMGVVDFSRDLS